LRFAFAKPLTQVTVLGPRSLAPPLFLKRCVRAYLKPRRCLPTSATATTYGHEPELSFPRCGNEAMTSFLLYASRSTFLNSEELAKAVMRGEPRCARSDAPRDWFLPVDVSRGICPTAIQIPTVSCPSQVRRLSSSSFGLHDVTRTGLWTERRTCPLVMENLASSPGKSACALAQADAVPLLILPEDIRCHR